ncbi:MAG: hypothetical protein ACQETO_07430 [Pseudomonadota bacterium]
MKHRIALVSLLAAMGTACSSIVSDTDYPVAINSQPDGAEFRVSNRDGQRVHSGTTPATVTLKSSGGYFRGETYTVELSKDGYADRIYTLSSTIDGWYWGNILLGGLIGMLIVDPATGAMYNLPSRVDITLDPAVAGAEQDSLTIATIDSLTPEQREALIPID